MKLKLYSILAVIALAGASVRAADTLTIVEQNETLSATFNGSGISLILTGPQDHWTVQLPNTFFLNQPGIGIVQVGEPENASLVNQVNVGTQPQFLIWDSDVNPQAGTAGPFLTTVTIPNAGHSQATTGPAFDLVLIDRLTTVPDTGSTAALLGLAVAGLAFARSGLRRFKAL